LILPGTAAHVPVLPPADVVVGDPPVVEVDSVDCGVEGVVTTARVVVRVVVGCGLPLPPGRH
jgi:hypothetical protein